MLEAPYSVASRGAPLREVFGNGKCYIRKISHPNFIFYKALSLGRLECLFFCTNDV